MRPDLRLRRPEHRPHTSGQPVGADVQSLHQRLDLVWFQLRHAARSNGLHATKARAGQVSPILLCQTLGHHFSNEFVYQTFLRKILARFDNQKTYNYFISTRLTNLHHTSSHGDTHARHHPTSAFYPQTPESARTLLRAHGVPVTELAREIGGDRMTVVDLLRGLGKGHRGSRHRAAIALGLKPDPKTLKRAA